MRSVRNDCILTITKYSLNIFLLTTALACTGIFTADDCLALVPGKQMALQQTAIKEYPTFATLFHRMPRAAESKKRIPSECKCSQLITCQPHGKHDDDEVDKRLVCDWRRLAINVIMSAETWVKTRYFLLHWELVGQHSTCRQLVEAYRQRSEDWFTFTRKPPISTSRRSPGGGGKTE